MQDKPIIITGGGTAGHITPLIAVAREIHRRLPTTKIIYIGKKGDANESVIEKSNLNIEIRRIMAGKYRRYPTQNTIQKIFNIKMHLLNLRDAVYTVIGFAQALFIILRVKPRVIFTKGSFVGVPVGLAAGLLRKKLVTHDSDVVPGFANRIVGPFSKYNAVATESSYPYPIDKIKVVGIPVRDEYYEYQGDKGRAKARQELGLNKDSLVLFIGGSTQGARKIDDEIEKIVPRLLKSFPKLTVVQVFGRLNEESLNRRYSNLSDELRKRLHLHEFLHDNYRYMAASDLLIGRAGATFLAEAAVLSSPCVIVPAPHLSGSHQVENARVLASKDSIELVEEKDLEAKLEDTIVNLLSTENRRKKLGNNLHSQSKINAAKDITDLLLGE